MRPSVCACSCNILVPHVSIECIAVPGTGKGHWVQASLGGQVSAAFNASMSYAAPVVAAFSGPGASGTTAVTTGGVR